VGSEKHKIEKICLANVKLKDIIKLQVPAPIRPNPFVMHFETFQEDNSAIKGKFLFTRNINADSGLP
jgi:hypothetical protein